MCADQRGKPASGYAKVLIYFLSGTGHSVRNYSTVEILNAAYYYQVVIIAYFLFFQLIRWKPLNLVFTWTTFTHIFRRYHDPETRISDLSDKQS